MVYIHRSELDWDENRQLDQCRRRYGTGGWVEAIHRV